MQLIGRGARRTIVAMGAALLGFFACFASSAVAQDALMPTPSSLTAGSYLVNTYPVLIPGDDDEVGFFVRGARGMTERLSVRASLGLYNDLTYLSATGDLVLPRKIPADLSLAFGLHRSGFETSADILGFDLALVGRRPVSTRFAVYGGFDVDFEFPEAPFDAFTRAGFVAGLDTRILEGLRLLVEGGLGLNDRSPNYVSVGLAVRLR